MGRLLRVQFSNVRGHAALEGDNRAFAPVPLSRGVTFPCPWKLVLRLLRLLSLCPESRGEAKQVAEVVHHKSISRRARFRLGLRIAQSPAHRLLRGEIQCVWSQIERLGGHILARGHVGPSS